MKRENVNFSPSVLFTSDYSRFKTLIGNRDTNELHIKRLIEAFKVRYLFSPILVNEKFEIIDGQHRFTAAKELGLPIWYIIVKGYGLTEVQLLNTNHENWNKMIYMQSYCDLGLEPYLELRQFMSDYPDFGIGVSEQICTNLSRGMNGSGKKGLGGYSKSFQEGKLIVPDIDVSYENAEKVMQYKPYYKGYNRYNFVSAMLSFFKNPNFDNKKMVEKIIKYPKMLVNCNTTTQYKLLLEEIYNHRSREKVNLRY